MSDLMARDRKPGRKKLDRPISSRVETIDVDTPLQNVLDWDQEGVRFQYDFERFLFLTDEQVGALSQFNREGYTIAKAVADKLISQQKEREEGLRRTDGPRIESAPDKLSLNLIGGSLGAKTRISGGKKDTHYCLKRDDELAEAADAGYAFVKDDDPVKTPGMANIAGTRRISRHGQVESVLMKIPKERYDQHVQAVADIGYGKAEEAREGFHEEGRKLKKKYHLEFTDRTRKVRDGQE